MTRLLDRLLGPDLAARWHRITHRAARVLLGPVCDVCGQHVYPRDEAEHAATQHPGETR